MYVVTVTFEIKPKFLEQFLPAMLSQARNSLQLEADCHRFDVCRDPQNRYRVFLYELYTDEAAFQMHLQSSHFLEFSSGTADCVISKAVQVWNLEPLGPEEL